MFWHDASFHVRLRNKPITDIPDMTLYYSHKTLEYNCCTHTPNLSNQNTLMDTVL